MTEDICIPLIETSARLCAELGGHCMSVDSFYLLKKARDIEISLPLAMQARMVNEDEVSKVAQRLIDKLRKGYLSEGKQKVLLLGFAYKKNCLDIRNTKVACLAQELQNCCRLVHIHDPLVDRSIVWRRNMEFVWLIKLKFNLICIRLF